MKLGGFIVAALAVSVLLAVFGSPFASSSPDGLEKVAADQGFLEKASSAPAWSFAPAADYAVPGVGSAGVSTALAGLLGTLATFGAAWGFAKWVGRRKGQS
ncbi:MAG: PDGLE domain-containing protein [FCB group bacterium]|jgi:cobalt/nickel transport protein|nr:PDGLE domain-containing protein [FCB group bacterium]